MTTKPFPERNFMVEVNQHQKHKPNEFYPDGDYCFMSGWLHQKHPNGYDVDYFTTQAEAEAAIEHCKLENPQQPDHWLTFIIYALALVGPTKPDCMTCDEKPNLCTVCRTGRVSVMDAAAAAGEAAGRSFDTGYNLGKKHGLLQAKPRPGCDKYGQCTESCNIFWGCSHRVSQDLLIELAALLDNADNISSDGCGNAKVITLPRLFRWMIEKGWTP